MATALARLEQCQTLMSFTRAPLPPRPPPIAVTDVLTYFLTVVATAILRYLSAVRTTRSRIGIFLIRANKDPEFNDRRPTRTQKLLELESEC